jgi:hypothetical protein
MIKSSWFNFIYGVLAGLALALAGMVRIHDHAEAAAPEQKPCAMIDGRNVTQEGWEFAQKAIRLQHDTIEQLETQLAEAKANPAAQMLAQSGHVMNEEQCRAWIGVLSAPHDVAQIQAANFATVLYESGRASLNVSLLPLPGAPRVAVGPRSELAPRWILPGRIQPQMVGETRKAIYYYYDTTSSQWHGPFAPERVVQ